MAIFNTTISGGGSPGPAEVPNYYIKKNIINGKLQQDTSQTTCSTAPATDVGDFGLEGWLAGKKGLGRTIDLSSLTTISGEGAFARAFMGCELTGTISFPNLTSVTGNYAFQEAFATGATTNMSFPALISVTGYGAFSFMTVEINSHAMTNDGSISFPVLENVGERSFEDSFVMAGPTPIAFPALKNVGDTGFYCAFSDECAATNITFGGTDKITFGEDPFLCMFLNRYEPITVTAPAANQAEIEAMDGYPDFGAEGNVTWNWAE